MRSQCIIKLPIEEEIVQVSLWNNFMKIITEQGRAFIYYKRHGKYKLSKKQHLTLRDINGPTAKRWKTVSSLL